MAEISGALSSPNVIADARFRAGRELITSGHAEEAIAVFESLLQQSIETVGPDHIESAPLFYEYGNAIFRAQQRSDDDNSSEMVEIQKLTEKSEGGGDSGINEKRRQALADAAERRLRASGEDESKKMPPPADDAAVSSAAATVQEAPSSAPEAISSDGVNGVTIIAGDAPNENDELLLALELMETCWSIMDQFQQNPSDTSDYRSWITEQIPRVLTGIGDVLSASYRRADAADVYLRALGHRQDAVDSIDMKSIDGLLQSTLPLSTDQFGTLLNCLKNRRLLTETNILVAEELLSHQPGIDVITSETQTVLVSAAERVEYARGYYDAAREALQEAVLLMGQLVAKQPENDAINEEKENVCFAATLVMATGETLAALDEEYELESNPPKAKKVKS